MRRIITLVAAAATTLLLLPPAVMAESNSAEVEARQPDRTREAPTLSAFGEGTAEFDVERGGMRLYVVGDITIEGPADLDVRIESWSGESLAASEGGTTIELNGFSGSVFIRGAGYTVEVEGNIAVHARGKGTVELQGTGLWKTKMAKGLWPAELGFDE